MELPLTPLDFLARARRLFPDREGVIDGEQRWTYRQLGERCDRLAHALRGELGVQPGDVVAWLCGNTHELLEAYYGVLLAGGVLLPLNIRLAPAELRAILDDSHAVVLFRHPDAGRPRPPGAHHHGRRRARGPPGRPARHPGRDARRRRARPRRALLHVRIDRLTQGRAPQPPRPLPPRRAQRAHDGAVRRRRRAAHDPALPRQRLGDAPLRDRAGRRARPPPPLRCGRGAPLHRGPPRHPALPRARHGSPRARPPGRRGTRSRRAWSRSRSVAPPRARPSSRSSRRRSAARASAGTA